MIGMQQITREHFDLHVDKRLRFRTRLYFVMALILLGVVVYRLFADGGSYWYALAAFLLGGGIGVLFSRMFKIDWDHDARKIVSRLDIYGGILLASYVAFEILSRKYLESQFSGPFALTIVFSLLSGVVIGRGVGMTRTMMRVMREHI